MKNLNLNTLFIALLAGLFFMTSCKKDNEFITATDMVVVWNVTGGEFAVTDNKDINDIHKIGTDGTLTLNSDGTGNDDFTFTFEENTHELNDSYTWVLEGTVITLSTTYDDFTWNVEK